MTITEITLFVNREPRFLGRGSRMIASGTEGSGLEPQSRLYGIHSILSRWLLLATLPSILRTFCLRLIQTEDYRQSTVLDYSRLCISVNIRRGYTLTAVALLLALSSLQAAGRREHFLSAGPGAAGAALGDALTAKGVDASAGFYNPATLIEKPSGALFEYSQPNKDAYRNWLALSVGDKNLKVGLLWKNESLPLSSNKNAFLLSAGISDRLIPFVPKGFSAGLTIGYVSVKVAEQNASATLASMGARYSGHSSFARADYSLGLMVRNIYFSGLQFRSEGEKEVWPLQPEIGGSISRWGITLLGSAKGGTGTEIGFGVAYQPVKFLELRAGMNSNPRMGIGLEIKKFRLDYAMILGQIQNANSLTLHYLWGKEEKAKDYTDPLTELSAKYQGLTENLLVRITEQARQNQLPELRSVLKLIAVDLSSKEGWNFYNSLTGEKPLKVGLPWRKSARRAYLQFAVAYAYDATNAKDLAQEFLRRYPNESVSRLIRVILSRDLAPPAQTQFLNDEQLPAPAKPEEVRDEVSLEELEKSKQKLREDILREMRKDKKLIEELRKEIMNEGGKNE